MKMNGENTNRTVDKIVALNFVSEMYVNIKRLLHMLDNLIHKLCTLINLTVGLGWGKQYICERISEPCESHHFK